jgi:hypothetical protein
MQQFHTIRIAGNWLTSNSLSSGTPYISEITGLDKLKLARQSSVTLAIDGTPYKQFSSNKGLPVSIKFPLIDSTNYNVIVDAINHADNAGTAISLYITGPMGTFALNVVSSGLETPGNAIVAGLYNATFNFVVTSTTLALSPAKGTYSQTGNAVTLTH